MTSDLVAGPTGPAVPPGPTDRGRLAAAVTMVVRGVLLERIAEGRLRNVGWPRGWAAVVGVGYAGFGLAAVLVLTGSVWRSGPLTQVGADLELVPLRTVWVFALLVMTVAALFHLGAVHGTWWSKISSLVIIVVLQGLWPALIVTSSWADGASSGWLRAVPAMLCVLAMIIFSLVRMACAPRWWEFVVFWVLLILPVIAATDSAARFSRPLGFEFPPTLIAQTMGLLALLCVPVAVASGTAVAELTVSVTVWVAVAAGRLSRRPLLLTLLVVAFTIRAVQTVLDLRRIELSWQSLLPALVCVGLIAIVSALLVRRAGPVPLRVTELPDDLTRIAIPIGVGLLGVLVPYTLVLFVIQLSFTVTGQPGLGIWGTLLSGEAAGGLIRGVIAVVLLVVAMWSAARRRIALALLEAHIAIFLLPGPIGLITQAPFPLLPDPDLLNVFVTLLAAILLIGCLIRRDLSAPRIAALGALVVLGAVFSGRDLLLAPLSWVFGPSAGLILVGLIWFLLTGCDRANVNGRRFSSTSRSAMMIGFVLLTGVVLAYYTLAGAPSQGSLDVASTFGDAILGTALLTGTVTMLVIQVRSRTAII